MQKINSSLARLIGVFCVLMFAVNALHAEDLALRQLPSQVGGRVLEEISPKGDKFYTYAWPSVYFETAFVGREVSIEFDDANSNYRILLDDAEHTIVIKPGKRAYKLAQLSPSKHTVRVEKLSETQDKIGRFGGFYAPANTRVIKPKARKLQIEFIGDSHTVGYGNTAPSRECSENELINYTDTQSAFGPLVAKHFNADYQINAYSGQGVVRNYKGIQPHTNLIARYPYALHDNQAVYANKHWRPQVIVIGLGTNDFSTPLAPDERWSSRSKLQDDYVASYIKFVRQLQEKNPQARFVLLASDKQDGEFVGQVKKVVAGAQALGVARVDLIEYKNLAYTGCHWHPSVDDNKTIADVLVRHLLSKGIARQGGKD